MIRYLVPPALDDSDLGKEREGLPRYSAIVALPARDGVTIPSPVLKYWRAKSTSPLTGWGNKPGKYGQLG